MKKKYVAVLAGVMAMCCVTACGGDEDVKVVNKLPSDKSQVSEEQKNGTEEKDAAGQGETLTGYIYEVSVGNKKVSITTDTDMSGVLAQLGEPVSYFESQSCAFKGLDKVYTYDHYRIETYPDGEKDVISSVVFLDDIAETTEGISIGMTKEEMESVYGTDHEEKKGMTVYTKDGKYLAFLLKDDVIQSIEYNSAVMDTVDQQ